MITVVFNKDDEVIAVAEETGQVADLLKTTPGAAYIVNRNDLPTHLAALHIANRVTEFTGETYFAADKGPGVSPRYDVVKMPAVGDKVSAAFNGDYYPAGEIDWISSTGFKVRTSDGTEFTRRSPGSGISRMHSAIWKVRGSSAFTMVRGHIDRRNPSF